MREVMDQVSGLHLGGMALALDGEHVMSRVWANCSSIDVAGRFRRANSAAMCSSMMYIFAGILAY